MENGIPKQKLRRWAAVFYSLRFRCGGNRIQYFLAGKAYLKITLLVKTPLHEIDKLHAPGDGLLTKLRNLVNLGKFFLTM